MDLTHKSQSALEYLMTYGWAILIIVIVAAVLYSMGVFNPSSSISTTITGFSGLGSVNAACLGGTSFTMSIGDSLNYPIDITKVNVTASSCTVYSVSPNVLISPDGAKIITIPGLSLCSKNSRYSVSADVEYTEPGQVSPGPYFSKGTVSGTALSPPSVITSYTPITITNSQSSGTPLPFQQMINVTSSDSGWADIASSPFGQNVEFFSTTGQVLNSWLENYTAGHALWWVKLPNGVPASDPITVYMGFAPTSTNLFNNKTVGEAPTLSPAYGGMDNGANVFSFYDNFAGSALDNKWLAPINSSGGSVSVDNGATLKVASSSDYVLLASAATVAYPQITEMLFNPTGTSTGGIYPIIGETISTSVSNWIDLCPGYEYDWETGPHTAGYLVATPSCSYTILASSLQSAQNDTVVGFAWSQTGNEEAYDNYASVGSSTNTGSAIANYHPYIGISNFAVGSFYTPWVRARMYPPNGVMPSVVFGTVS